MRSIYSKFVNYFKISKNQPFSRINNNSPFSHDRMPKIEDMEFVCFILEGGGRPKAKKALLLKDVLKRIFLFKQCCTYIYKSRLKSSYPDQDILVD